jgi:hypothetical protein
LKDSGNSFPEARKVCRARHLRRQVSFRRHASDVPAAGILLTAGFAACMISYAISPGRFQRPTPSRNAGGE